MSSDNSVHTLLSEHALQAKRQRIHSPSPSPQTSHEQKLGSTHGSSPDVNSLLPLSASFIFGGKHGFSGPGYMNPKYRKAEDIHTSQTDISSLTRKHSAPPSPTHTHTPIGTQCTHTHPLIYTCYEQPPVVSEVHNTSTI